MIKEYQLSLMKIMQMKWRYVLWIVLIGFPIFFLVQRYLSFEEYRENGPFEYKGTDFDELDENDFVLFSKEGSVVSYFKVEGVSGGNKVIARWGHNYESLTSIIGDDIYELHRKGIDRIFMHKVIQNKSLYVDTLSVLLTEDLEGLKAKWYYEIYGFSKKDFVLSEGWFSSFTISPLAPLSIIVLLVFLLFCISFLTNLLKRFISTRWIHVVYVLIIGRASLYFNLPFSGFLYPDSELIQVMFAASGMILMYFFFNVLTSKIKKRVFIEREVIKFFTLVVLGPIVMFLIVYASDIVYEMLGHGVSKSKLNQFRLLNSWSYLMYNWVVFGCANFLHNLLYFVKDWRRKSIMLDKSLAENTSIASELNALQSRVNPHFLYNALNSIAALAVIEPQKTEKMALSLAKFYKYNTNRNDEPFLKVKEELELLQSYLEVEQIRFGDKLQVVFDVKGSCLDFHIPKFMIQPLLENAIKFGYKVNSDAIAIKLEIREMDKLLYIRVYDGGILFDDELQPGYGITSIKKKLELVYPKSGKLLFVNEPMKYTELSFDPNELK